MKADGSALSDPALPSTLRYDRCFSSRALKLVNAYRKKHGAEMLLEDTDISAYLTT
jgi:hypothetical protein